MSEASLAHRYERMLVEVGARASEFGVRPIASHWPFVGSRFNGTLIAGKALAGWDADETGARWLAEEATTDVGRERILDGTRAWANARPEPMYEVLRFGHRRRSPFWGLSRRLMETLEPGPQPWYSGYAYQCAVTEILRPVAHAAGEQDRDIRRLADLRDPVVGLQDRHDALLLEVGVDRQERVGSEMAGAFQPRGEALDAAEV
jgi:hypothetical protein